MIRLFLSMVNRLLPSQEELANERKQILATRKPDRLIVDGCVYEIRPNEIRNITYQFFNA